MDTKTEDTEKGKNNAITNKEFEKKKPSIPGAFNLVVITLIIIAAGWFAPRGLNWILIAIFMFIFMVVIGQNTTGQPLGILINERKLMSLSRFQIVIWTVLILSAYFTMAMERIRYGDIRNPLDIEMDWRLWVLMGISTTSLVGTPMIQSAKKRKEPEIKNDGKDVIADAADAFGELREDIDKNREGLLYGNKDISNARFADMFEGDELKNTQFLDMAKVQMFFFTIVAALSYVVLLFNMILIKDPSELSNFPVLPEGLIAILGISHAGYLADKFVDRTKPE